MSENKNMDICELLEKVKNKLDRTKELRSLSLNKATERNANGLVGRRLKGKLFLSSPETYKLKF